MISVCTFFDSRNRYFGTFTFVKMDAFPISDVIPWLVDSLKYENTRFPQNRYVVKCGVVRPKNCVNTSFITSSVSSGDNTLHTIPSTVRLYFFLKSRFTSSSNRNSFCLSFCIIENSAHPWPYISS